MMPIHILFFLLLPIFCNAQAFFAVNNDTVSAGQIIIKRSNYTLLYDCNLLSPLWGTHILTKNRKNIDLPRKNKFVPDGEIKTAVNSDYLNSGFDRGHVVPAEDLSVDSASYYETFYYSNITPEIPTVNRVILNKIERYTRQLSPLYDTIFIITGCKFNLDCKKLKGRVAIPPKVYKVIICKKGSEYTSISFVIPNVVSEYTSLLTYVTNIEDVEKNCNVKITSFARVNKRAIDASLIDFYAE